MPSPAASRTLAVHFVRFGPYHLARLRSAADLLALHGWRLIGLETAGLDRTYAWRPELEACGFERQTVFPEAAAEDLPASMLRRGIHKALCQLRPEAVAIAGWASPDARACLDWCCRHGARPMLMSDTRRADGPRPWWKEAFKRRLLRRFDAALVAGRSQRDYLKGLGFPDDRVAFGFDVVDNAYFRRASAEWSRCPEPPLRPFLLASNRFLPRKNLSALLRAFAGYRDRTAALQGTGSPLPLWDLCLLGDGPERLSLLEEAEGLGLPLHLAAPWDETLRSRSDASPALVLPGFRQIEELPRFLAHACAFVHPALSEPWGLVINEAMACGLPILCSANVGAAEELLEDGVNGLRFDPASVDSIRDAILRLAALPEACLQEMGAASARLIDERCPTSAFGEGLLQLLALPRR